MPSSVKHKKRINTIFIEKLKEISKDSKLHKKSGRKLSMNKPKMSKQAIRRKIQNVNIND